MKIELVNGKFLAIVDGSDGERRILTSDSLNDVIEDWYGKCDFCPCNDARVYFAMFNEKIINPFDIQDFESLMGYLMGYYGLRKKGDL